MYNIPFPIKTHPLQLRGVWRRQADRHHGGDSGRALKDALKLVSEAKHWGAALLEDHKLLRDICTELSQIRRDKRDRLRKSYRQKIEVFHGC